MYGAPGASQSIADFTKACIDAGFDRDLIPAMIQGYAVMRSNEFTENKLENIAESLGQIATALEALAQAVLDAAPMPRLHGPQDHR